MKSGYKTTEFWVTALTTVGTLAGSLAGLLPGNAGIIAAALASGLYAVSRGLSKAGHSLTGAVEEPLEK